MKKFQFYRQTILIVSAITLLAAGCSKDKSTVSENAAKISNSGNSLRTIDPNYQPSGAIKGYVLPADAKAMVTISNATNDLRAFADDNGFFFMEKVPAGVYTIDVEPMNGEYQGVQFDVIVIEDQTTKLTITLLKN